MGEDRLHRIQIHPAQGDVLRLLIGREHDVEPLRLARRLGDRRQLCALRLGEDARGVAPGTGDDIVVIRLSLVAHALGVGIGTLHISKAFHHGRRRIDFLQLNLGDLDPHIVAIEDFLRLMHHVVFDLRAQLGQRRLDRCAANDLSHRAFRDAKDQVVRTTGIEQELRCLIGANAPEYSDIDVDDVLVAGQHEAFRQDVASGRVAAALNCPGRAGTKADLGAVDPGHGGPFDPFDGPGDVPVQARRGPVFVGAEAQHDPLLVRLYAVEAAGEPKCYDHGEQDRHAAETHAMTAGQQVTNESLGLADYTFDVGQWTIGPERTTAARTAAARASAAIAARILTTAPGTMRRLPSPSPPPEPPPWPPPPDAAALVAARVTPGALAAIIPGHLVVATPAGRRTIGVPDVIRHIWSRHTNR